MKPDLIDRLQIALDTSKALGVYSQLLDDALWEVQVLRSQKALLQMSVLRNQREEPERVRCRLCDTFHDGPCYQEERRVKR